METTKAGAVIFTLKPKPLVLLLKSSNPSFGGPAWQLPKGSIDPGEEAYQAAIREANEEAGLMESDIVGKPSALGSFTVKGLDETYNVAFWAVETKQAKVSGKFHYETSETKWFTLEDAAKVIRMNQRQVLDKFISKINYKPK